MPTIMLTIKVEVPEGTTVSVSTDGTNEAEAGLPPEIAEAIDKFVPSKYREGVMAYLERCVTELECSVEMPDSERKHQYVNIYPPPRCRRSRVADVGYRTSRTAVYTGAIDLDDFDLAKKTTNGGQYVHPKLLHLDSAEAVDEAVGLSKIAIARLER